LKIEGKNFENMKEVIWYWTVLLFRFNFTAFKESAAITKAFNSTDSFDFMSFMTFNDTKMTQHIWAIFFHITSFTDIFDLWDKCFSCNFECTALFQNTVTGDKSTITKSCDISLSNKSVARVTIHGTTFTNHFSSIYAAIYAMECFLFLEFASKFVQSALSLNTRFDRECDFRDREVNGHMAHCI